MHLFDANDKLKKYAKVSDIIDDYFETRLQLYQVRKDYLIDALTKELILLSNKTRYIKENLDGSIDLRRKKREEVSQMLTQKQYTIIDEDTDFKYLTRLPMDSVTEENVAQLEKEHKDKSNELDEVKSITIQKMWERELFSLEKEYTKYRDDREKVMLGETSTAKKPVKKLKISSSS
jgi:DNA topoisomerase-2